jgi:hypothetical protein
MAEYEVQYVTLSGGRVIPAHKLVCPVCKTMDMNVDIQTDGMPWVATCGQGHKWDVNPEADA